VTWRLSNSGPRVAANKHNMHHQHTSMQEAELPRRVPPLLKALINWLLMLDAQALLTRSYIYKSCLTQRLSTSATLLRN
jgi:hypothetical protein